ncbi:MAG: acyl-CoA dehydrogenase [Rhodospirillales bacterium]|jgi:alkylation response protein AidB-like acyl-CoA dehydrogenase|nr:acyl-CoA dehydrogenase [Rhodospirillales bacterium]HIJ42435.1 acyl-CoA dehydrogenase [Rhodospirillaceae bacterium]MDP7099068.1 acyl-CoA dehydrogenase [Rhodospirillales bacterium]MDP7216054.1 acyl-CoA dehydrogenase [Rhodospirillales bacterium]HIJ91852.1 acyl-CoA dehydrogenase [Rhodospirillaceae bacterium]
MTAYAAPLTDMRFVIGELAGLAEIAALPGLGDTSPELVDAILDEAGKFGAEVLAPLNRPGDIAGCGFNEGLVRTPEGFKEAYGQFVEGGWNGLPFDPEYGGHGLPWLVSAAVSEIWNAANMALALCPLLTQGAAEMLIVHGSSELKSRYLRKLVSGEWTGTMNLTEPQAGSDLGQTRCKAVRKDGRYLISGQKIFITYGDHDLTENIIHTVLARTPDAPPGVKGLSLFVVPKFLLNEDGSLGERNDLRCLSIEHKLGINASPTCVMSYGDGGGASGFLIGEETRGIEYMFTMMNNARLAVGLEGVAIAERAYQQARDYARARVQGRLLGGGDPAPVAIVNHPDVRRMLLFMKAGTEAARALAYHVAASLDLARRHPDEAVRRDRRSQIDLLTPVIKAWCTDTAIEVANTGIQVHGGMGYIEETGAAQHLRDARIAAIYEGTNGIQALDLVGRKVARDKGAAATAFIATVGALGRQCGNAGGDDLTVIARRLLTGVEALGKATDWLVETYPRDPRAVAAGAVHYLRLFGIVAGGWLMARAALRATAKLVGGDDAEYLRGKVITARFFADQYLLQAEMLATLFTEGLSSVQAASNRHL